MSLTLENTVPIADCGILTIVTSHSHTPAAAKTLKRGGGDLSSHTSLQSS